MKTDTQANIITTGILILIFLLFLLVQSCSSSLAYNNGTCPYCGGTYVFKETVGHRYTTHYIYICNKCGNLIESSTYFNSPEKNNQLLLSSYNILYGDYVSKGDEKNESLHVAAIASAS